MLDLCIYNYNIFTIKNKNNRTVLRYFSFIEMLKFIYKINIYKRLQKMIFLKKVCYIC